jgi:IS30 family transposase
MPKRNKHYQQLTEGQRYQIQALHSNGFSQRKIAHSIKVHPSTVSRELARNRVVGERYCAPIAIKLTERRKLTARKYSKIHERHNKIIADGLLMGWSPEKLSLRMKLEVPELALSHATIYRRIAADKVNGGQLYTKLSRFGKRRYPGGKRNSGRSLIPNRVDISQRPQEVANRLRIGDWEGDTVHGKNTYLLTLAERRSRLVLIGKAVDKKSETAAEEMSQLLQMVDKCSGLG